MMNQNTSGRLPGTAKPHLYQIHLDVNPSSGGFSGSVKIHVEIPEPSRSITLHSLELKIKKAVAVDGDQSWEARVALDEKFETARLDFEKELPAGPWILELTFSGTLNRQLRGFYRVESGGETFAFTQLEATDARRVFPCFDEPALKARFQLTVTAPSDLAVISNMPPDGEKLQGGMKTVRFEETPLMSTYLLALAVARLEKREIQVGPTKIGIWTVPGQLHLCDFAFKTTAAVLPLLNDYFDLPYPYPKLDLISVPDFAMGAMENWGAIFFRDSALLLDEARSSANTQRWVANVITHEIVHQWFGNLVTMEWWDDLWLNESFATWLACKIVDQWRPEWNSWTEFQQEKHYPLALDALSHSRPIQAPVHNAAEIEEMFDALTYEKGAACLRMMEQFLGPEAFRAGIRNYIRNHQFKNARAEHLWEELGRATGQPVSKIAGDWFTQAGYPLLTVESDTPASGKIRLTQNRFLSISPKEPDPGLWTLPFVLHWKDSGGIHFHRGMLREQTTGISLPVEAPPEWIHSNAGESGFFRSSYSENLRALLRPALARDLTEPEIIGYLNHLWSLCQAGKAPISEFMEILLSFKGTKSRFIVEAMTEYFDLISGQLVLSEERPLFEGFIESIFESIWDRLGWDPGPGEGDEQRLARASALWTMGALVGNEDILSELPRRLTLFWSDPDSLEPTLLATVLRICIRTDGGSLFEKFTKKVKAARSPEDRDRFLMALGEYKKPALARKVLEFSLSSDIRSQDSWRPIRRLQGNIPVQGETWKFIREHWGEIRKKSGTVGAQRIIQGMRSFWKPEWRNEIETFFREPENRVEAAGRALEQTLEFIDIGIQFRKNQQENLSSWLKEKIPGP